MWQQARGIKPKGQGASPERAKQNKQTKNKEKAAGPVKGDSRQIAAANWRYGGRGIQIAVCSKHERACNSSQPDKWRQHAYEAATLNLTSWGSKLKDRG